MKKYLITGGTGFLGHELVKYLYGTCHIRVMARNEGNLIKLKDKYPNIEIFAGDIADSFEVMQACKGINGIFHLAAFKHVGMAETQSYECIKSNTIGSLNVLQATMHYNIEFVIGISTDKAAQVVGVYGASKMLMERLFNQYSVFNENTKYRIVRYGNVLFSTGSVITKWIPLLQRGEDVIITDPNATRFYWTVEQAISLIFECLANSIDTTPYCPEMKSLTMGNMLEAAIIKYGNKEKKSKVIPIGLQKGENLHEKILDEGKYSNEVEQYTIDEILELI